MLSASTPTENDSVRRWWHSPLALVALPASVAVFVLGLVVFEVWDSRHQHDRLVAQTEDHYQGYTIIDIAHYDTRFGEIFLENRRGNLCVASFARLDSTYVFRTPECSNSPAQPPIQQN